MPSLRASYSSKLGELPAPTKARTSGNRMLGSCAGSLFAAIISSKLKKSEEEAPTVCGMIKLAGRSLGTIAAALSAAPLSLSISFFALVFVVTKLFITCTREFASSLFGKLPHFPLTIQ